VYADLIEVDADKDKHGLEVRRKKHKSSAAEDSVVFSTKPLLEPLALVQCTDCGRRVKMDAFATHSERCKKIREKMIQQSSSERVPETVLRGIPKGTKFNRGPSSIKPTKQNVGFFNRWKGSRIQQLEMLIMKTKSLPSGVDPSSMSFKDEPAPLQHMFGGSGKKSSDSGRKESKSKRAKPKGQSSGSKDNKNTKNTKKESKEKRPKKAKGESKRSKGTKRSTKKGSSKRKSSKVDDDLLNGPVTLNLPAGLSGMRYDPRKIGVPKPTSLILK